MKIFFLCHTTNPRTGTGRLVSSIIKSAQIAKPELEISMATANDLLSTKNKLVLFLNLKKLFVEAKRADLIHVFDAYPYGLLAIIIGFLVHKPVILTAIGSGSVQGLNHWPRSILMTFAFKKSRRVIAISCYVRNKILAKLSDLNITVINPGLDYSFWSAADRTDLDPRLVGKDYVLSVGTFKKRKGYDISLRVFRRLWERHPNLYYVIVGDPVDNEACFTEIQKMIETLGISDRVIILNKLTDEKLRAIYSGARLFILLSWNDNDDIEGFGQVFVEAAAAGAPIIGSLNSSAEDAVCDSRNGYLVDLNNESDIVQKAEQILTDDQLRRTLAGWSPEFAKNFDWKKIIIEYLKLYAQIQS